jgi:hypothetical protein
MPDGPVTDSDKALARLSRLWNELQAARKNPVKYKALEKLIRREADTLRRTLDASDLKP